jgi:hypothetical protein
VTRTVSGMRTDPVHADGAGSTVVTAEIPAVPMNRSYGVLLPDGSVWYPGSKKRLPAPWPVRFVVWVLALVLILMLGGVAVVKWHPAWLAPLRHTVGSAPLQDVTPSNISIPAGGTSGPGGGSQAASGGFRETGSTPQVGDPIGSSPAPGTAYATVSYHVPAGTYQLAFKTSAREPVSVGITTPSGQNLYGETQPGGTTHTLTVSGTPAWVQGFASGGTIEVLVNNKSVGDVTVLYAVIYKFDPAT